jgi:hypothetical protein
MTSWEENGWLKGGQSVVLRLLRRRFGELAPALADRIRQLPAPKVDELADALLDFKTTADVDAWLAANG